MKTLAPTDNLTRVVSQCEFPADAPCDPLYRRRSESLILDLFSFYDKLGILFCPKNPRNMKSTESLLTKWGQEDVS